MTPIQFFAHGIPKPQPRPRAFARKVGEKFVARVFDAGTAEGWKAAVALAAKSHLPSEPMTCALSVTIKFFMPRPKAHFKRDGTVRDSSPIWPAGKPDLDNCAKAVLDCLTQLGAWRDDNQIVSLVVTKVYPAEDARPGAWIEVSKSHETEGGA